MPTRETNLRKKKVTKHKIANNLIKLEINFIFSNTKL